MFFFLFNCSTFSVNKLHVAYVERCVKTPTGGDNVFKRKYFHLKFILKSRHQLRKSAFVKFDVNFK